MEECQKNTQFSKQLLRVPLALTFRIGELLKRLMEADKNAIKLIADDDCKTTISIKFRPNYNRR
jgi:hypothetical protein